MPTSKDPHGKGFREVSIVEDIPYFKVISEESAGQRIMAFLKGKDWIPTFIICRQLNITRQVANQALLNLAERGLLDVRRKVIVSDGSQSFKSNLYKAK